MDRVTTGNPACLRLAAAGVRTTLSAGASDGLMRCVQEVIAQNVASNPMALTNGFRISLGDLMAFPPTLMDDLALSRPKIQKPPE